MRKIGIGMIGLGGAGGWGHYPGYIEIPEEAKIVALCDNVPARIEAKSRQTGAKTYTEYEKLLADPDVEAVDITLPHYLHAKVALAAIEAGKHVIVEKPFTITVEEADAVISAAKRKGVKLMVAENTRFVEAYEVARKMLDQDLIGRICYAEAYIGGNEVPRLRDPSGWNGKASLAGGGVIMDSAVHSFYLLRWMVGKMKTVSAFTTKFMDELPIDTETNAVAIFKFENGALGHVANSETTEHPWTEQLQLVGVNGSLVIDMLAERPLQLYSTKRRSGNQTTGWTPYGSGSWEEPFIYHSALEWKTKSMRREVQHFVRCIAQDTQPWVTGEDGREDVRVAVKCYESASTGRPVEIGAL
jgi:predicted dehydrogenase